jgi:hypothetical protein
MKVRLVGAELFHDDGQTDRHDEANSRFCNFAYTLKNDSLRPHATETVYLTQLH